MTEPPRNVKARHLRFPYPADLRLAILLCAASVLPLLPLLLLMLLDPAGQSLRIALLVMTGLLLIGSICAAARMLFGIIRPLGTIIHDMEARNKTLDSVAPANNMLDALVRLSHYFRAWEEHQYRLEILQKQADLHAFQSQINPHFLYNMLDTIRGQALEDGSFVTSDMIEALSKMMRYAISNKDTMVKLGVEIKSIDNYIKIQQFRFGNRFQYIKRINELDNDLIELKIPKMTLQPIVENALFHGIESLLSGGEIVLKGFSTQSRLILQISDNGEGMEEDQLAEVRRKLQSIDMETGNSEERGTGIALTNVNARLKLAFGSQYGLSVFSTRNVGTMVEITLPITGVGGDSL